MFNSDQHIGRAGTFRFHLNSVDDTRAGQQLVSGQGLAGDQFKEMYRPQPFGLSTNPPKGSHGFGINLGGRPDHAVILGLEHASHRPVSLSSGESALYDANGQIIKMLSGKKTVVEVGTLTIIADKVVVESSNIFLGGEQGAKPVAIEGTVTTDGARCISDLSTTVKAV